MATAIAWIFAVLTLGYLIPGAIATTRKHPSSVAVWCVNVLLGWSVIGWIVALIWALTTPQPQQIIINNTNTTESKN